MALAGRLYSITVNGVTLSAAQDLFSLKNDATHIIGIHSVSFGQITGTTVANLRVRHRYMPATFTQGSGGSSATINKWITGDAASSVTARINDTTQGTTGGTAVDLGGEAINTVNGWVWYPPIPGRPFLIPISAGFVVSLDSAPASLVSNATIVFEEAP